MAKARQRSRREKKPNATIPDVFIFESMDEDDESNHWFEGQALSDMLRLAGKNPKYFYFRHASELPSLFALFAASRYRYLHFSCHASSSVVATTHDSLSYETFASLAKGYLDNRRIFLSACELGNKTFVNALRATNPALLSVIAPAEAIEYHLGAAFWTAFYVSIFSASPNKMKRALVEQRLNALAALFPVQMYYSTKDPDSPSWLEITTGQGDDSD
jgi:hypothetical protein